MRCDLVAYMLILEHHITTNNIVIESLKGYIGELQNLAIRFKKLVVFLRKATVFFAKETR